MYNYHFHIIDREYNDEYDFEGFFFDHMEADRFITENEQAGNTVIIMAPFIEWVPLENCPNEYQIGA
jgi:hypothetical protein